MKLLLSGLLVFVVLGQAGVVAANEWDLQADAAAFTKSAGIELDESILVPTPVQVRLPDYFSKNFVPAVVQKGTTTELVFSEYVRTSTTTYTGFSVIGPGGALPELTDARIATAVEFAVENGMSTSTTLLIKMAEPVSANAITFSLAQYGVLPDLVNVTATDIAGRELVVVATKRLNDTVIYFPERTVTAFKITFEHTQPLRLTELGVRETKPKQVQNTELLFLAVPGATYAVYFNPEVYRVLPLTERPYFTANDRRIGASLVQVQNNPYFTPPDSDLDGIIDKIDNCPKVSNPGQEDIDGSGTGDLCEDFDRDGVTNAVDNCPDVPNRAQKNIDADALGDECDESDDRFTEQNPLIPWLGLLLAVAAIGFMFMEVRKRATEVNEKANDTETDSVS